jgi:YaiO family outer membrane protein
MRYSLRTALIVAILAHLGNVGMSVAAGVSLERAGLGLKAPHTAAWPALGLRGEPVSAWQGLEGNDVIYAGVREATRFGLRSLESYSGIYYPLSDAWGVSLETGMLSGSPLSPRRYSLAGQLHNALAGESGWSIGFKYRIYDTESTLRPGLPGEGTGTYALVPAHTTGTSFGPSYQLQLNYQYNAANIFGLALGRELETFTPGFESLGNGPRQFMFTGQHWLTPSWALSYDVLSNDPGNLFRLQGLRFGVRYRF